MNTEKLDFTKVYVCPNYGIDTLINGNISECIRYYNELIETGRTGLKLVIEEMNTIKTTVPDRYEYILKNLKTPY